MMKRPLRNLGIGCLLPQTWPHLVLYEGETDAEHPGKCLQPTLSGLSL